MLANCGGDIGGTSNKMKHAGTHLKSYFQIQPLAAIAVEKRDQNVCNGVCLEIGSESVNHVGTHFQEQTQRSNSLLCQISDRYYFEFLDLFIP